MRIGALTIVVAVLAAAPYGTPAADGMWRQPLGTASAGPWAETLSSPSPSEKMMWPSSPQLAPRIAETLQICCG